MIQPHTMTSLFKCGDRKKLVNLPERRASTFRLVWLSIQTFYMCQCGVTSLWVGSCLGSTSVTIAATSTGLSGKSAGQCNYASSSDSSPSDHIAHGLHLPHLGAWPEGGLLAGYGATDWGIRQAHPTLEKEELLEERGVNVVLPLKNELCYLCRRVLLK